MRETSIKSIFAALMLAAFLCAFAPPTLAAGASGEKGESAMSFNITDELADAADLEREFDPDAGGVAIRLLKLRESDGKPEEIITATSGFIVKARGNPNPGELNVSGKLYEREGGLTAAAIRAAAMFDIIADEESGEFARYIFKAKDAPRGSTREWRITASASDDISAFVPRE